MSQRMQELIDYHYWANGRMLEHVLTLPEEAWEKEMDNVFATLRMTFSHLVAVDGVWLSRLEGHSPNHIAADVGTATVHELLRMTEQLREQFVAYLSRVEEETVLEYSNTKGEHFRNTVMELVQHITHHGAYHRGNAASMFRQMGFAGVSTDYIMYLRTRGTPQ